MPHLPDGIQNSTHTGLQLTWQHEDKTPHDLTGATMTGRISSDSGAGRAIVGVLVVTNAINGIFQWAFGDGDIDTVGNFEVQFIATFGDDKNDKTFPAGWEVVKAL